MPRNLSLLLTLPCFAFATPALAQLELPAPSPAAEVTQRVGLTDVSVKYSSPGVKGRKIWGELVPYDQLWRTGANKATRITFSQDVKFGGKAVKAGSYAVYTIPSKKEWTVILNTVTETSGTGNYDKKNDVARITAKAIKIPARERMTFLFSNTTNTETRLDMEWEKIRVSVPITVETEARALAAIDKNLGRIWVQYARAAEYMLQNGGDMKKALAHIDTSVSMKKHWWNHWMKAKIHAQLGQTADAIAAAQAADKLGADNKNYQNGAKKQVTQAIAQWKKSNKS